MVVPSGNTRLHYERVQYAARGGAQALAWVIPAEHNEDSAAPAIWAIFFHGAGSNISHYWRRYMQFNRLGLSVLAPEYTGYGERTGTPSEEALRADALAAYRYLQDSRGVPAERILLYGFSLGSGVAIDLASRVDAGALVVEGAFVSAWEQGARRYPFFPVRLLMRNRFDSNEKISGVRMPVLFVHGRGDRNVPIEHARRLYERANAPKTLLELNAAHSAAIGDEEAFLAGFSLFLRHLSSPP